MRYCIRVFALALALASATVSLAQSDSDKQVAELQKQISALKTQLDRLQPPDDTHVTQIGGSAQTPLRGPDTVIRFYDLSDLFMVTPTYRAERLDDLGGRPGPLFPQVQSVPSGGAGMGGMGGGVFNMPDSVRLPPGDSRRLQYQFSGPSDGTSAGNLSAARTSIEGLIETITATINPASWDAMGGPGTIARLGGGVVISTTSEIHQQIDSLLKLFRKRWGGPRVVSVRAWWMWLNDAQLASLLDSQPRDDEDMGVAAVVDPLAWKELLEELPRGERKDSGYRAAVSCYNGQTVYAESGGQSLAVTAVKPAAFQGEKDKDGKQSLEIGYQPEITVLQAGAALQLTPIASSSGKFVVLDVHSRVTRVRPPEQRPPEAQDVVSARFVAPPEEIVAAIDRPVVATQRLSTTMRVPVDRVTLVGGMTFDNEHGVGEGALYLFVKTAVREVREEAADAEKKADP